MHTSADLEEGLGLHLHHFDSNFQFEHRIYSKIFTRITFYLILLNFQQDNLLPKNMSKDTGWVANSIDSDETPRSAAFNLGLHYLLRPFCSNT